MKFIYNHPVSIKLIAVVEAALRVATYVLTGRQIVSEEAVKGRGSEEGESSLYVRDYGPPPPEPVCNPSSHSQRLHYLVAFMPGLLRSLLAWHS